MLIGKQKFKVDAMESLIGMCVCLYENHGTVILSPAAVLLDFILFIGFVCLNCSQSLNHVNIEIIEKHIESIKSRAT